MAMNKEQVMKYLDQLGIEYDGRWAEEKLMALVAQYEQTKAAKQKVALETITESPTASEQIKKGTPVFAEHHNTAEEVREAIAKFLAIDGFTVTFDGDNWHFKCKGVEECGNLNIPLRVILMKAESVSKGTRSLIGIKGDGKYKGYADNIMMV